MRSIIFFCIAVSCLAVVLSQNWAEKDCSSLSGSVYINRVRSISIDKAVNWSSEEELEYVSCVNFKVQYEIGGRAATYKLYYRLKNSKGVEATYEVYTYVWGFNGANVDVKSVSKVAGSEKANSKEPASNKDEKKVEYPGQKDKIWFNINCNSLSQNEKASYEFAVKELNKKYGSLGLTSKGCFSSQVMVSEGVYYKFQLDYMVFLTGSQKRFVITVFRNQSGNLELKSLDYLK